VTGGLAKFAADRNRGFEGEKDADAPGIQKLSPDGVRSRSTNNGLKSINHHDQLSAGRDIGLLNVSPINLIR